MVLGLARESGQLDARCSVVVMASDTDPLPESLPPPGPPFQIGEQVAFFPAEIGPTSDWLRFDFAVIDDINEEAESIGFHFVSEPGVRHAQGFENIVRRTPNYEAWRSAWEDAFARTQNEKSADGETETLWLRVLAEHPIHGGRLYRHVRLPSATE